MLNSSFAATATTGTAPVGTPTIRSSLRRLDRQVSSLNMQVSTGGRPFYEVLLATEARLLGPGGAADRTERNFFSSSSDGGLLAATSEIPGVSSTGGWARYLVPQSVLAKLMSSEPRPRRIFFVVIAYADEQRGQPAYELPMEMWATHAAFVEIGPSFRLSRTRSFAFNKLRRVRGALSARAATAGTSIEAEDAVGLEPLFGTLPGAPDASSEATRWSGSWAATAPSSEEVIRHPSEDPRPATVDATRPSTPGANGHRHGATRNGSNGQAAGRAQRWKAPSPAAVRGYDDGFGADDASAPDLPHDEHTDGVPAAASLGRRHYRDADAVVDAEEFELPLRGSAPRHTGAYGDEAEMYDWDSTSGHRGHGYGSPLGRGGAAAPAVDYLGTRITVEPADAVAIIERIGEFEAGGAGYSAMNRDGEFEGRFDGHPATGRYHIGLSYGIVQFTQDSGNLGKLLRRMRQEDEAAFLRIFVPDRATRAQQIEVADALIAVTTAEGPFSSEVAGGRSARVQPVDGHDLWSDHWAARFDAAGDHIPFQALQNMLANELYIQPMLPVAGWLGLDSPRALTMLVDRSVQQGVGGARRWVLEAVGPLRQQDAATYVAVALGREGNLQDFQRTVPGVNAAWADGQWGPQTHAALVAALRAHATDPRLTGLGVAFADRAAMLDRMRAHAAGAAFAHRVERLRDMAAPDAAFDQPYPRHDVN